MLAKHADDLLATEIPDNVYAGLKASPVTDVHVFGRRGPAQVKFTPLELRELSHSKDVDIVLYPEDFEFDEASDEAIRSNNQTKTMVGTLTNWLVGAAEDRAELTASRRLHLHFLHSPVEIYDDAADPGRVSRHQVRAHRTGRHRQRPRHRRVRGLPGPGRLPRQSATSARRCRRSSSTTAGASSRTTAAGCWTPPARPSPDSTPPAGSSADPSGLIGHTKGDALETVDLPARGPREPAGGRRPPRRTPSSTCWRTAAWNSPPGKAGWHWTPTSVPWARRSWRIRRCTGCARAHQGGAARGDGCHLLRRRRRPRLNRLRAAPTPQPISEDPGQRRGWFSGTRPPYWG